MNIEESIQQIETLIETWQLDEEDLNQTDINAMQVLLKENKKQKEKIDKAIEHIKNNQQEHKFTDRGGFTYTHGYFLTDSQDVLDILKEVSE